MKAVEAPARRNKSPLECRRFEGVDMCILTEEEFLKDIVHHKMEVLLDSTSYRHLQFKNNGSSNMWFDIVTWPGFLSFSGDMGCFVFSRIYDMFKFFRYKDNSLKINPSYWGEKLQAVDNDGYNPGYKEFSEDKFHKNIQYYVDSWLEPGDLSEENVKGLLDKVREEVHAFADDGEYAACLAASEFYYDVNGRKSYQFFDFWEQDNREYTFRYIWCCYAIVWAIQQYDNFKEKN